MSDSWIIIIPDSQDFIPSDQAQQQAVDFFKRLTPNAEEVKAEATTGIEFFDCGENLSSIVCPSCGGELDIYWWQDCMEEESEAHYPLRLIDLPCCHHKTSVDKLKYDWPQGFARFSVEAMNPDISDLSADNLQEFERILGCKVLKIRQHI